MYLITDDGSLDFTADRVSDTSAVRATLPTASSSVNILRKHFIYHKSQPLKRSQPGKLTYIAIIVVLCVSLHDNPKSVNSRAAF